MPQLVKGGKNVFGWSKVSGEGRIVIPPDAYTEYQFSDEENAYLISGSKKSGGFGLTTLSLLRKSPFSEVLTTHPELTECKSLKGKTIHFKTKVYCCAPIDNKTITIPFDTLKLYGVKKGSLLLTVRGSYLALGFIVRGPILEEAKKHSELKVFE